MIASDTFLVCFFSLSCSYSKICRKHLLTRRISLFCLHLGKPTTSSSEACRFCGSRSGTELSAVGSVCPDADCQVRVSVAPHSKEQRTCVSLRTPLLGISEGLSSESLSFSELAHYLCQELAVLPKLENGEVKPSTRAVSRVFPSHHHCMYLTLSSVLEADKGLWAALHILFTCFLEFV